MSEREDRLRSLLNKVRAKRPDGRTTRAADALDRIRTASGTTAAAAAHSSPAAPPPPEKRQSSRPVPVGSSLPEPPTSPSLESPTRYSSQPPRVERPLSVEPRAQPVRHSSGAPAGPSSDTPARASSGVPARPSSGAPAGTSSSGRPESIRPQSVAPTGQPVVYATDPPEFPRAKTFGDLLDLTLSLRPR